MSRSPSLRADSNLILETQERAIKNLTAGESGIFKAAAILHARHNREDEGAEQDQLNATLGSDGL